MAFGNPIIGGGDTLVRNAIQSEGFVAGSTGWRIERTGSAEFNSVTVRGELDVGTANSYVRVRVEPPSSPSPGPVIALNADAAAFPVDGFIHGSIFGGGSITMSSPYDPSSANTPASLDLVSGSSAANPITGRAARIGGGLYVNGDLLIEPAAGNPVLQGTSAGITVTGNLTVTGIGQRQTAVAAGDVSTSGTTLVSSGYLTLPVVAGATYTGRAVIFYTATFGNDLSYAWDVPSGTTGKRGGIFPDTSSALGNVVVVNDRVSGSFATRFDCGGSNGFFRQAREEMQFTAGASGNVTLQWAERAAGGSAAILANSFLTLERIA
ncbi:hypothetical protein [Actinomadura geliboluensis]|uniref:hypothetical protein n=1 Tax=Actinomadura geliboluensis TaxID=882440 RepID=UPI0026215C04|nr:hypothetical protein [Actinomadura geliboluensis]